MKEITQLTCLNCKHTEDIENMNFRKNSKIFMSRAGIVNSWESGLDIYTMLCFACKHLTNFASDPTNESGKAIKGVQYFETFKYNDTSQLKYDLDPTGNQVFNHVTTYIRETNGTNKTLLELGRGDKNKTLDHVIENLKELK